MTSVITEVFVLLLLLVANGVFAMTEIAIVSARKPRLRRLAEQGDSRARTALELAESPNRFLSTVQLGITLVGIFAGAFGGATLAKELAQPLGQIAWLAPYAKQVSLGLVVIAITYFSLVIGELVPKRIGLGNPEGIALGMAKFMHRLSVLTAPLITFLSKSTEVLLRLFGVKARADAAVTEDEVRGLMQEGLRAGAFNKVESHIIHSALDLDQLTVRDLMTEHPARPAAEEGHHRRPRFGHQPRATDEIEHRLHCDGRNSVVPASLVSKPQPGWGNRRRGLVSLAAGWLSAWARRGGRGSLTASPCADSWRGTSRAAGGNPSRAS